MFSNDHTLDTIEELLKEIRRYLELQKDYLSLNIVEKLIILLSTLLMIFLLIILIMIGAFYLSFTAVYALENAIGNLTASYAIVGSVFFVLALLLYVFRKKLILLPMARFLTRLFLDESKS